MYSVGLAIVITALALFLGTSVVRSSIDMFGAGAGVALQMLGMQYVFSTSKKELWTLIFGALVGLFLAELLSGNHSQLFACSWRISIPFILAGIFMAGTVFSTMILLYFEGGSMFNLRFGKAEKATMAVTAISACVLGYELGLKICQI
jgi:hypothetical protein